ncbi:UNVERIFIED_CONTAM: hypothetical protein K2H54_000150 [Gekko kuhli]
MPWAWPKCACCQTIPPHRASPFCSSEQRLAMVALAAAENPGFVVDERELKRDTPSWTIDTLIELRHELPDTPLCFLMGMDSLLGLPSWHRWQELLDYAHLVSLQVADLHRLRHGRIWLADNLPVELSATRLRALLATGADPRYLLPPSVAQYIRQQGLYRPA